MYTEIVYPFSLLENSENMVISYGFKFKVSLQLCVFFHDSIRSSTILKHRCSVGGCQSSDFD